MPWNTAASGAARWDQVYRRRGATGVSWFETVPDTSLALFDELGIGPDEPVLDAGAGTSALAAALLRRGFGDVTVLDISEEALRIARERLGEHGDDIQWIAADLLTWTPTRQYGVWHDRAVFHFLTGDDERQRYRQALDAAVGPGGAAVIGTFAADGPSECSGRPVCGYDADALSAALGPRFEIRTARRVEHRTPSGAVQPFTWVALRRT